ncbi:hypothetical protein M758_9G005000 [Ceratodon purpureus]|nr:hypothetical protein M758_9G005000 [Ceratodon purpureus]
MRSAIYSSLLVPLLLTNLLTKLVFCVPWLRSCPRTPPRIYSLALLRLLLPLWAPPYPGWALQGSVRLGWQQ